MATLGCSGGCVVVDIVVVDVDNLVMVVEILNACHLRNILCYLRFLVTRLKFYNRQQDLKYLMFQPNLPMLQFLNLHVNINCHGSNIAFH